MADSASSGVASDSAQFAAPMPQRAPSLPVSVNAFYTFEDGSAYEGYFALTTRESDDRPVYVQHGTGVYVKGNYTYSGEWRDGKMTHGVISFPSGDTYEGHFLDGLFHGWGRYTWYKEDKYYEGMWVNGLMEGPGTLNYVCLPPGEERQHPSLRENPSLLPSAERSHSECKGIFGAGKYHHTPALRAAVSDEYMKRYRGDWLGAAVEVLQQIEAALLQNTTFSGYVAGGQSTSQGGSQMNSVSTVAPVGAKHKNADPLGAAVMGMTKKRPPLAPHGATTHSKDQFVAEAGFTGGLSFSEDEKYMSAFNEYVAEKYVSPPFPVFNDFHVEGISRLVTAARGYLRIAGNTGSGAYSVEVRIPTNEQELAELSLLDKARILDAKAVVGRGSGQIVELILRSCDGTGNILAGVVLINCNDQTSTPEAAHLRVVSLVLASPQQMKKLR